MASEINKIKLREADTTAEKILLGLIKGETDRMDYGKITLELVVQAGEIKTVQCVEVRNTYKLTS